MTPVPKYVDKEARRRHIAAALQRIAAKEGLEGVSIRTVAAEAGLSVGAVQRDFATKDELLLFALRKTVDAVTERFSGIRIGPQELSFAEGLRAVLLDLLPADAERLAHARVWAAFYTRATVVPEFAGVLAEFDTLARTALTAAVSYAEQEGELAPGLLVEEAVELILVLIDGVWLTAARQPPGAPVASQRMAIDAAVTVITGGP